MPHNFFFFFFFGELGFLAAYFFFVISCRKTVTVLFKMNSNTKSRLVVTDTHFSSSSAVSRGLDRLFLTGKKCKHARKILSSKMQRADLGTFVWLPKSTHFFLLLAHSWRVSPEKGNFMHSHTFFGCIVTAENNTGVGHDKTFCQV